VNIREAQINRTWTEVITTAKAKVRIQYKRERFPPVVGKGRSVCCSVRCVATRTDLQELKKLLQEAMCNEDQLKSTSKDMREVLVVPRTCVIIHMAQRNAVRREDN
jgi:hypothetical protein